MTVEELIKKLETFPKHWQVTCTKVMEMSDAPISIVSQGWDRHNSKLETVYLEAE